MNDITPFRVGILGGMGPLAGVELHRLIIDATPAKKDQDHLEVVLYTNPKIPDRTTSLQEDGGESFATVAQTSVRRMQSMNLDIIAMACMTAHSRIRHIQSGTDVPLLNGISLVQQVLRTHYSGKNIALLATSGSIQSGIYTNDAADIQWNTNYQSTIMEAIYAIKAGRIASGQVLLKSTMRRLQTEGSETFVLGCTELGLLYDELQEAGFEVIDPLRQIAATIVEHSQRKISTLQNTAP